MTVMPDTRKHRGSHPHDKELFAAVFQPSLREAVRHLSWLLTRGYAMPSSLKLVGDRFTLTERQRLAVARSSCSDQSLASRRSRQMTLSQLSGETVDIDGFNLLTTIEAALSGGVLLEGRDDCIRDMASMHGSYRRVEETIPALTLIGETFQAAGVNICQWWLDQPVSNSGRLKKIMLVLSVEHAWPWTVNLVPDPDTVLRNSTNVVITADGPVLDDCHLWTNLAAEIVQTRLSKNVPIDLRDDA
ncbi:MAG: DUF434 domain-containing protein [Planctomycetaceae bacterium]|nr:DUF434 domain-containing protein [Planctomycetaceae bacterium]